MTKQLADFLKGSTIDDANETWLPQYFNRFRALSQNLLQGKKQETLRGFLEELAKEGIQSYRSQQISPKVYSHLLFIWKVFDLCIQPDQYDYEVIVCLWVHSLRASLSKGEDENLRARMKKHLRNFVSNSEISKDTSLVAESKLLDEGQHAKQAFKNVPTLLFKTLIDFEKTETIKELIRFLYLSYEQALSALLHSSDSLETWLWNIAELIPYLLLKNFVPIHDTVVVRNPSITLVEKSVPGGASHLIDTGTVSRVSRFFRDLFTLDEIQYFEQTAQRISETFAHIYPIVLSDIQESLIQKKTEIMKEAQINGRMRGLQLALTQYKSRLSIPKYIYEEIIAQV